MDYANEIIKKYLIDTVNMLNEKYNGIIPLKKLESDFQLFKLQNSENIEEDINKKKEEINEYATKLIKDFLEFQEKAKQELFELKGELNTYNLSLFPLDEKQQRLIDILGLENIKEFEKETMFFSTNGNDSFGLPMLDACALYFSTTNPEQQLLKYGIDFKNGTLPYEEFSNQFAACLNVMRMHKLFTDYPDYDFIDGKFRESHPEIFISKDAPKVLKNAFYENEITPDFLFKNKECIKYLTDKNLSNTIKADIKLSQISATTEDGYGLIGHEDFCAAYTSRYGNEKFLELCSKYGKILSSIEISGIHNEIEDEQAIEKSLRNSIYKKIINVNIDYFYLSNVSELVLEHPEIFVDFDGLTNISEEEKQRLTKEFYKRTLNFGDIKKYPQLITILKDKNLKVAFGNKEFVANYYSIMNRSYSSDLELLNILDNEKFLLLCSKYGDYMNSIMPDLKKNIDFSKNNINFTELIQKIENIIAQEVISGNKVYHPDDAPNFLLESHPELFLDNNAPEELKKYFYGYDNGHLGTYINHSFNYMYLMSFELLHEHKDWLPFLKDKSLITALLRNKNTYSKRDLIEFFEVFGEEKAIKLGVNKAETVKEMIKNHQVDLMKEWYDKTGGKFIPDFVVMQNFRIEEADKFLASGSNWSTLMKIKSFSKYHESRDAMLKLAYCFGAFDQDQAGMKKLQELLTGIPRKYESSDMNELKIVEQNILEYNRNILTSTDKATAPTMPLGTLEYGYLKEELKKDGIEFTSENIFSDIFNINSDMSATLKLNPQSHLKAMGYLRKILEEKGIVLNCYEAHKFFGGFELKYDKDFREFLLKNFDEIRNNTEYTKYISSVQRQFDSIKAMNSNRALTWDLAVSFVQSNKYENVNIGNDKVAEISAIAGYSQEDFNILQQIYNYGKTRTFSSIPRIEKSEEKTSGRYTYETLRLDDPLAMVIGNLTDCCQELNNCAEVCMEHSMVDKNGRVFVIKDEQGNIVAQSWVWRNKDVLCFDNIEIPDKAFVRATKEYPHLDRKRFTDDIFEIYKQAANDLIKEDEKAYKELFETGKITEEQYDGLRLRKVTVGLGYNDIAESLKQNSQIDKENVARPLPFEEPIKLSSGLYTSDSVKQYVLEQRDDRKIFHGDTLAIHNDNFIEYTDSNFTEKELFSLEKLEIETKKNTKYLNTSVSDYAEKERLITEIAENYDLNPETAKIVMNPNFAIIYDLNNDKLRIGDLLFNTKVDNGKQQMDIEKQVIIQMKLAFEQIANGKEIDVSALNEKQLEMYGKIAELTDEIDIERGVRHAK